jgi:hypothetical protein
VSPSGVAVSPDRQLVATVVGEHVRLRELAGLRDVAALKVPDARLVAFPTAGSLVAAQPGRIVSWPLTHDADGARVGAAAVLHEGATALVGEECPDEASMRFLATLRGALGPVPFVLLEVGRCPYLAISGDGRWAALRVWQKPTFHVWDLERRERAWACDLPNAIFTFTPDGRHFLVNGLYEPCRVYETGSWRLVREIDSDPSGVAVSADGSLLALAALPSGATLHRLPGFEPIASLQTEGSMTSGELRFNPQGDLLAVLQQQRVQLWDLAVLRQELDRLGLADGLPAWPLPVR